MAEDQSEFASILKEKLLFSIQSLCEIGEELSSIEKFESSSQSVLHLIMGTLVISKAGILIFDDENQHLKLAASRGVENTELSFEVPANVINKLHHSSDPIFVENTEDQVLRNYFDSISEELAQLYSHIWIPLKVKSRLLGVISISKKFMGQEYEPVDLELLNIIVQQLSISINNFYLIKNLKDANFQLNRKLLELETLYDLGIAIGSIMEVEELSEQILINSVGLTDASSGFLALRSEEGLELAASINLPEEDAKQLESFEPVTAILEKKESYLDNSGEAEKHPYGIRKLLIVPLSGQYQVLGLMGLADKESRSGLLNFTEDDRRLLLNFATQAGVAIENAKFYKESVEKERLEKELQVAATIQRNILPDSPPEIPGLEIVATTIPSRFVGGDHYDFHSRGKDHLFSIADVSGKGIPAALLVSTLHATQHALISGEWDVQRIVQRISSSIFKSSLSNKFITFFLISYDADTRSIRTVNAGHNPPLIISQDGEMKKLTKGGLVLGLLPDVDYDIEATQLKPGDVLVTFTDGVNEAMNIENEEFGDDRFEALLIENRHKSAREIFNSVMDAISEWTAGAPQHDDITLVIYKVSD